jgi:Na+/H+-dicarboxylate symporter
MRVAPLGVMALLTKLTATQDLSLLASLARFIFVVVGSTLFHGLIILPLILYVLTRKNPLFFLNGIKEAMIMALSTSSSSATLPVTLRCVQNNLKVDRKIASFVLPLGATINMDGTALYEAMAAIFVANIMGVELSLLQQVIVLLMAVVASVGAPGIPSAGMVTMVMVLQAVGLPAEAIAILLPIDRILDTIRTAVNVEGDCAGSLVVQHLVGVDSHRSA